MRSAPPRSKQRGITMLMTLVIIGALLGLGLSAMWMSSMSTRVATNLNGRQAALNAANAGIQHARLVLAAYANAAGSNCPSNVNAPWSCILKGKANAKDDLPTKASVGGKGAILHDGQTPLVGVSSPTGSTGNAIRGTYTVWVRNDASELSGAVNDSAMLIDANRAVVIRALGTDASGSTEAVVEASMLMVQSGTAASIGAAIFGKNVDPYGSNSVTGSFTFGH